MEIFVLHMLYWISSYSGPLSVSQTSGLMSAFTDALFLVLSLQCLRSAVMKCFSNVSLCFKALQELLWRGVSTLPRWSTQLLMKMEGCLATTLDDFYLDCTLCQSPVSATSRIVFSKLILYCKMKSVIHRILFSCNEKVTG